MTHRQRSVALVLGLAGLVLASLPTLAQAHVPAETTAQTAGPRFIFPANGQTFPYGHTLLFQVQRMREATGYLWGFVQHGALVWQNLDSQGTLSLTTYTISPGSRAARALQPGNLQVRVRAHLSGDRWSAVSTLSTYLQGRVRTTPPTATPVPATPVATSAPQIHAGDVLYTANTAQLFGDKSWKHSGGMLVNDGTSHSTIILPYHIPVSNYAVEAEVQVVSFNGQGSGFDAGYAFGLRTRMTREQGGYSAVIAENGTEIQRDDGTSIGASGYTPDTSFHTYRLEVRSNHIRLLVDEAPIIDEQDNRYLTGDEAGIYDGSVQINVRAIRIIAL